MSEDKEMKLVFLPGCFDSVDLDQEELDELVNEIKARFADGTILQYAEEIGDDEDFPTLNNTRH